MKRYLALKRATPKNVGAFYLSIVVNYKKLIYRQHFFSIELSSMVNIYYKAQFCLYS